MAQKSYTIRSQTCTLNFDRPLIMGILNSTPDSFSDGGKFTDPEKALAHAIRMQKEGADIIDIGGESTRPGAEPASVITELSRVIPIIERLTKKLSIPLSIDTTKSVVAGEALKHGAHIINDTSALTDDPRMSKIVKAYDCPVILMHRKGTPRTMQTKPHYKNVIQEIETYFKKRISSLTKSGINEDSIIIDPGIGFGKTVSHNVEIMQKLNMLGSLKRPVAIGVSRKSFIGTITGEKNPKKRLIGSLAAIGVAALKGAHILRVHDVKETKEFLDIFSELLNNN
ncbi:MAG: dihydropteroate synthase [Candidatus Ancaeobacter aquaticus]|nr:dihydropteroate synthase [Candidatus Ancaeobacter aquaticus]